jgi:hypothetical protein
MSYRVGKFKRSKEVSFDKLAANDEEPAFSLELLDLYYKRLFPYDHMFRWLSYGNDPADRKPGSTKDFFYRREWSFTLAGNKKKSLLPTSHQ